MCERYVVAQKEVGKTLEVTASRGIGFLRGGIRCQHAALHHTRGNGVKKSAESAGVITRQCVFILAIVRINAAEFQRMRTLRPGDVATKVVLVREVVVITKGCQVAEAITCDRWNKVASSLIR